MTLLKDTVVGTVLTVPYELFTVHGNPELPHSLEKVCPET